MECVISYIGDPGEFYAQIGNEKKFLDFTKLVSLIQTYCATRATHFHSVGNVEVGEILFIKSTTKDGLYVRGRVLAIKQDSCSALLVDYGGDEDGIDSVLKIDPAVRRFADIEPQARKYSLAFVKPTGESWSAEATELFRQNCGDRLIYLPTEHPDQITLIVRNHTSPNNVVDLSVLLIQAYHAKRLASFDSTCETGSVTPSIAPSISNTSQQLHSVGVQTDQRAAATSPVFVKPPPCFGKVSNTGADGDHDNNMLESKQQPSNASGQSKSSKQKAQSAYIPPALRGGPKNTTTIYTSLKMSNHDSGCICIICTIRNTFEIASMSHKERLEAILLAEWAELSTKEEAVLRCSITGTALSSEDRELLLDIMLGLAESKRAPRIGDKDKKKRPSMEMSTQVTSSSNKLILSSSDVIDQSDKSTNGGDDITIMRLPSEKSASIAEPSKGDTWNPPDQPGDKTELAAATDSVMANEAVSYISHAQDQDPDNWSDPEDHFLDDSSSDSDPDIIIESSGSTATVNRSAGGNIVGNRLENTCEIYSSNQLHQPSNHFSNLSLRNQSSPGQPVDTADTNKQPTNVTVGLKHPIKSTDIATYPMRSADSPTYPRRSADSPTYPMRSADSPTYPRRSADSPTYPRRSADSPIYPRRSADSPTYPMRSADSPKYSMRNASSPTYPMGGAGSPNHLRGSIDSKKQSNKYSRTTAGQKSHVISYGLGLSSARSEEKNPYVSPSNPSSVNSGMGGFGMIMYCTFCGSTEHSSASCPEGTKNLFVT